MSKQVLSLDRKEQKKSLFKWNIYSIKVVQNEETGTVKLTVQSNVVEGENDRSVSFRNSLHGTVDSAMWRLNIMLL